MSPISRRMRFTFTAWPPFLRCQVIGRTAKNGVSGNCRSMSCISLWFIAVSPSGAS
ncbi:hypothetical protein [Palleronia rufa]|uniref:hypothetical protein n=1 Tax=Palleronia rufa TaxID=1530186 RepID=UPI0039EF05E2